jgi:hypothetical protein
VSPSGDREIAGLTRPSSDLEIMHGEVGMRKGNQIPPMSHRNAYVGTHDYDAWQIKRISTTVV